MQTSYDLDQAFTGIEYLDGTARLAGDGTIFARSQTSIDTVATQVLALNVYRDVAFGRLTAYAGAGVGAASVEVRGVTFSAEYGTNSTRSYDPPLSFYNGSQDVDLSDTVSAWLLHVGVDYAVSDRTSVGAKLTYSRIGDIADSRTYIDHPMHVQDPGFTSETTFDATQGWLLAATLKVRLGR